MSHLAHTAMPYESYLEPSMASKDGIKAVKATALRYLARREYSRLELFRKLSLKYASGDHIQAVLDELEEQGYQSDDRFTEMFIRTKVRAGNGPFKIKIELREKGICESTVLSAFDRQSIDWLAIAQQVQEKRFGRNDSIESASLEQQAAVVDDQDSMYKSSSHKDPSELAKQIRYLKNKGFYQEHIEQVVRL